MSESVGEVEVISLDQLIEIVTPKRADPNSGRLRDYSIYRGVGDLKWSLLTSLDRLGMPEAAPHSKGHLEEHLLRNFMRYSRAHFPTMPGSVWEFLVIAQHHGLPTRLLDWTYSPLVAAHFATMSDSVTPKQPVIWRLDWRKIHEWFGLPPLALTVTDLDRVLSEKGFASPWDLFHQPSGEANLFICMLEPPALDFRILMQSSSFTLCSDKSRALDEILIRSGLAGALTKFVIVPERIRYIRDQLDLCGVNEQRLFPDLGGVASAIRRYYAYSAA